MKVLINLGKGKSYQAKSKCNNQLDAAADIMKRKKFYGLIPTFCFKENK